MKWGGGWDTVLPCVYENVYTYSLKVGAICSESFFKYGMEIKENYNILEKSVRPPHPHLQYHHGY